MRRERCDDALPVCRIAYGVGRGRSAPACVLEPGAWCLGARNDPRHRRTARRPPEPGVLGSHRGRPAARRRRADHRGAARRGRERRRPGALGGGSGARSCCCSTPRSSPTRPTACVQALHAFVRAAAPSLVLFPHTYQTRDFAPALAARLGRSLITDCIGRAGGTGGRAFTRPMFQGKLAADVIPLGETPHLVSFQVGAYRADQAARGAAAVRVVEAAVDPSRIRQQPDAPFQEAKGAVDLSQAERIVAVGRGIKSQENIALAEKLAAALGRGARGVASHLRCRVAADGAPDRQLRPDGRAEAVRRGRHLRRHPARRRDEGRTHHRRDQQGRRRARSSKSPTTASPATSSKCCLPSPKALEP